MIRSTAISLAKFWSANGIIDKSEAEIYQYGLELFISTLINLIIMVGISAVLGHPLMIIPYLLGFIPFRLFAGGYHAKNHLLCILLNTVVFLVSCLIALNIIITITITASAIESCISFAIILVYAPVSAKNKSLSIEEKKRNQTISLVLAGTFLVVSIALYYAHLLGNTFCNMLFCGQLMATALLLIGKSVESVGFLHY